MLKAYDFILTEREKRKKFCAERGLIDFKRVRETRKIYDSCFIDSGIRKETFKRRERLVQQISTICEICVSTTILRSDAKFITRTKTKTTY